MENFEKQSNIEKEQTIEDFQKEIKELQKEEKEKKGDKANPDLMDTKIDKLTVDDMNIWRDYESLASREISQAELYDLYEKLREYRETVDLKKEPERYAFSMLVVNRISGLLLNLKKMDSN